jgi:ABC-type oligopeptide transport system substrate-binding subunit
MNRNLLALLVLAAVLLPSYGCDSKSDTATKGREAVKEVVTQPFNTLEAAKESLNKSEDKTKAAIEEFDKESKQP